MRRGNWLWQVGQLSVSFTSETWVQKTISLEKIAYIK